MVRVDFSITRVPRHILITTPAPQHTPFGVMETVMPNVMPNATPAQVGSCFGKGFQLLQRQTFLCFSSTECCSSQGKMTVPLSINALVQRLHSKQRGPVCAWGSAADRTLSRQPLFAQLPCSEKSPEVVGCPVQFVSLVLAGSLLIC